MTRGRRVVELERIRRRLEAFLVGLYNRHFVIAPTDPAPDPGYWRKHVRRRRVKARASDASVATDGTRIWLPRALADRDDVDAETIYRVTALTQAELSARGAVRHWPVDATILERDLFALYEGTRAEHELARRHPGLLAGFEALRQHAFDARRLVLWPSTTTRRMGALVGEVLGTPVEQWPAALPSHFGVESALAWTQRQAAAMGSRWYQPLVNVWHWGTVIPTERARTQSDPWERTATLRIPLGMRRAPSQSARASSARKTQGSGAQADSDPSDAGQSAAVPDPAGAGGLAWPDADPHLEPARVDFNAVLAARYREWDHQIRDFIPDHAAVFESVVPPGDAGWSQRTAAAHAGLIRRVQREFQTLGARRTRLPRQQDGDELDLAACVDFMVDLASGRTPDDRVYALTRPPRGGVALGILADCSGSASAALGAGSGQRIIDIEKVALLVATYAMEMTADRHTLLSFSSIGAAHVAVRTIKTFDERGGSSVGDRIASLAPAGRTRLGAAIRHATSVLLRERASRHLLLIISDGIPNDSENYIEDYGIEDSRIAVLEARAQGVKPHCLTLSNDEQYAVRIFGPAAQVLVRRPEQLPRAVLSSLSQLLRH